MQKEAFGHAKMKIFNRFFIIRLKGYLYRKRR